MEEGKGYICVPEIFMHYWTGGAGEASSDLLDIFCWRKKRRRHMETVFEPFDGQQKNQESRKQNKNTMVCQVSFLLYFAFLLLLSLVAYLSYQICAPCSSGWLAEYIYVHTHTKNTLILSP